jgi:hypothetical protein
MIKNLLEADLVAYLCPPPFFARRRSETSEFFQGKRPALLNAIRVVTFLNQFDARAVRGVGAPIVTVDAEERVNRANIASD